MRSCFDDLVNKTLLFHPKRCFSKVATMYVNRQHCKTNTICFCLCGTKANSYFMLWVCIWLIFHDVGPHVALIVFSGQYY